MDRDNHHHGPYHQPRVARGNALRRTEPRKPKAPDRPAGKDGPVNANLMEAIAIALQEELEAPADENAGVPLGIRRGIPEDDDLFASFIAGLPPDDDGIDWPEIVPGSVTTRSTLDLEDEPADTAAGTESPGNTFGAEPEILPESIWPPCSATTRRGTACNFPARRGSDLCINHDPDYQEQQRQNRLKGSENARKARNRPPINFEDIDLTDRASIQAFVETVIALEFRGALSAHRARNLIRLLSLASRNLRTSHYGWVQGFEAQHANRYRVARNNIESHLAELAEWAPEQPE